MSIQEAKEDFVIRPVSLQFSRGLVFFWMVLMEVKELLLLEPNGELEVRVFKQLTMSILIM